MKEFLDKIAKKFKGKKIDENTVVLSQIHNPFEIAEMYLKMKGKEGN
jgi:hypothetical protein